MAAIASQDADLKQQPANLNTSPKSTVSTNPITEEKSIPSSNGEGLHVECAKQLEHFKAILASNASPETIDRAQKAIKENTEMIDKIAEHNKNMAELEVWASEQRMPAEAIKEITEMIAKGGGKANSRGLILLEKYKYTAALYYLSNNSLYQDYGFPESELKVLANEIKQFEQMKVLSSCYPTNSTLEHEIETMTADPMSTKLSHCMFGTLAFQIQSIIYSHKQSSSNTVA